MSSQVRSAGVTDQMVADQHGHTGVTGQVVSDQHGHGIFLVITIDTNMVGL